MLCSVEKWSKYDDVIFVHTQEEAEGLQLGEDVWVLWPSAQTQLSLYAFNFWVNVDISEGKLNLPENLSFPLTLED